MISKNKKVHRHVLIVFLLFAAVGVLTAMAYMRPPLNLLPSEPPEVTQKRLDKENNAWYSLVEMGALLPPEPPQILFVKDENGLEVKYKPAPNSLSDLLQIWRPDNDPLLLEYIQKTKPLIEQARAAAQRPFFMFPPVDWSVPPEKTEIQVFNALPQVHRTVALLVLDAASKPCSEDPAQDACHLMRQVLNLSFQMNSDRFNWYESSESYATDVIRKASLPHQQEMLQWLDEVRHAWSPNNPAIDYLICRTLNAKMTEPANYGNPFEYRVKLIKDKTSFARHKLFVRRHERLYRQAAQLTIHQYELQKEKYKSLYDLRSRWFDLYFHRTLINANSYFFARVDGLRTAVALEMYRRDRGAYPDSIDLLAPAYLPEIPKSPYDGLPFTYQRHGDDYELECVKKTFAAYYASLAKSGRIVFHLPPK